MTRVLPGTWVTIATATTNSAGRATFSYGPPYNTQFRAVFAGATGPVGSRPAARSRSTSATRPSSGLAANTTTVVPFGTRVTYTATVRPIAPAGTQRVTFLIYKKVGGVWTFRTSATVSTSYGRRDLLVAVGPRRVVRASARQRDDLQPRVAVAVVEGDGALSREGHRNPKHEDGATGSVLSISARSEPATYGTLRRSCARPRCT